MPFTQESPEWNASGTKPPQSKLDSGWQIGERPPSGWWNWTLSRTHASIRELQLNAIHTDQKGVANGVASLGADGKVPASQLNVSAPPDASTTVKGIVMLEDSVASTSITKAATPKNVKQAYDLANAAVPLTQKGVANGLATLDASGKVPVSQLNLSATATQSSNGFMSSADKTAIDKAQKWRLTENTGVGVFPANGTNFDSVVKTGLYRYSVDLSHGGQPEIQNYWHVEVISFDEEGTNVLQKWTATSYPVVYLRSRTSNGWHPFRKITDTNLLGSVIMGNKLGDTKTINFSEKVAGSVWPNPHLFKGLYVLSNILQPPNGTFSELTTTNYQLISKLDGEVSGDAHNSNGTIVQNLFSFDIIAHVERTYGVIPGTTTAHKVNWLRANISNLTFKWHGSGYGATGNGASIVGWNTKASGYFYLASHSASTRQTLITNTTTDTSDVFDDNGFVHFLAFANPSDGVTPSVIHTDYAELQVELSTDIKTNLLLASQTEKGLMSPSDKAKLDGIEAKIDGAKDELSAQIGILSGLNTTAKENLVSAVNELFTFANDGKTKWSSVIGSPLASSDTFTQMQSKTQTIKNTLATNLTAMGKTAAGTETLTELVNKVSISYSAGTSVAYKGGGPADTSSSSMIPYAESNVNMNFTGTARVEFRLISSGTNDAYAQIYKNGTPFGTLRTSPAGGANIVFTEDISVSSGDYIQIYFRTQSTSGSARIMDFFVKLNIAGAVTRR